MKTYLIFDGNNAAWRLHAKMPTLTTKGNRVQVVFGFLRLVRNVLSQFPETTHAVVCWDRGRSRFRTELYPQYKMNREHNKNNPNWHHAKLHKHLSPDDPDFDYFDCLRQMTVCSNILPLLNVAQCYADGLEADDCIAICTHKLEGKKIIVTSDMDMLHLVDEDTSVWSPIKTEHFTLKNFQRKLEMTPQQFLEFRALVGDSGDNIPGVAHGFGEVTAKELILKYGSIETLMRSKIERKVIKKGNRYALLYGEGVRERIKLNMALMDLRASIENEAHHDIIKEARRCLRKSTEELHRIDRVKLQHFFMDQAFTSMLADFSKWLVPFEYLDSPEDK